MKLEMIGLSHRTSDLCTRERAAVTPDRLVPVVESLLARPNLEGVVVLSTCNRTEFYLSPTFHFSDPDLRAILRDACALTEAEAQAAYIHRDADAARHLFMVASGLESQLLGEIQILAQVKQAYHTALDLACATGILNRVFMQAIECGKLVRTRTAISHGAVSVASAAVEVAQRIFGKMGQRNVLLIGAGATSRLCSKLLTDAGAQSWRVANRSPHKAHELAETLGGQAVSFPPSPDDVAWADVVVSATSSPDHVLVSEDLARVLQDRRRPLLFLDLAVPRDIDPRLANCDGVYLYGVDDFHDLVESNLKTRAVEAVRAATLVDKQMQAFVEWYREHRIAPTIQQLQSVLEAIRAAEVERQSHRFSDEDREELDKFSRSIMKKVTSLIVANMKRASVDRNDLTLARAVTVAFDGGDPQMVIKVLEKLDHELSH